MELLGTGFILIYFGLSLAVGRYWIANRWLSFAAVVGLIAMTCVWLLAPLTTGYGDVLPYLNAAMAAVAVVSIFSGYFMVDSDDSELIKIVTWIAVCGVITFVSHWHREVDFWASMVLGLLTLTTGQVIGIGWWHKNFWQLIAVFAGLYILIALITLPAQPLYEYYVPAGTIFFLLGMRIGLIPHRVRDLFKARHKSLAS